MSSYHRLLDLLVNVSINLQKHHSICRGRRYPVIVSWEKFLAHGSIMSALHFIQKCCSGKDFNPVFSQMIVSGLFKSPSATREVIAFCSGVEIGMLEYAALCLRQVVDPDPFVWNAVIRGYEQSEDQWKAINSYFEMLENSVPPDKFTFPFVLRACAFVHALKEGEKIHCRILKSTLDMDLFVQGSLIFMYARCGRIEAARNVFDAMPYKNLVSWNTMIDGYIKCGSFGPAFELFYRMPERDLFSWNIMIDGLSKQGQIDHARNLFEKMPKRDIVSWNSMIDGYVRCGKLKIARMFCDNAPFRDVVTWGIMFNGFVESGLVWIAHNLFEKLPYKNLSNWNCLINGYIRCGTFMVAWKLFELMPHRNVTSWNVVLDAFAKNGEVQLASEVFGMIPAKDVVSWNIMIDAHIRCGSMVSARELFYLMPIRDVVSWNAIISGYKQNGQCKEAIQMFNEMHLLGVKPDCTTIAIVLSAIAELGLLFQGKWLHVFIDKNKYPLDGIIGVALLDMYCKCGHVDVAAGIFGCIPRKNKDHWNAMISGFAMHGYGSHAVSLFKEMERFSVQPDGITFVALLNACSHAGLIHEGYQYFLNMEHRYNIKPSVQHYGCMVDLLGRSGHLGAAVKLVWDMPMRANDVVWLSLLSASKNLANCEIAEFAARHVLELLPHDSSPYVLLSNVYGHKGQRETAGYMWKTMKTKGVAKSPACSSIELQGILHEFKAGDASHPELDHIYFLLGSLTRESIGT